MAGQPPEDSERIEELLSQLQGIFSKLTNTEEAEAKEKVVLPAPENATPPVYSPPPLDVPSPVEPMPAAPESAGASPLVEPLLSPAPTTNTPAMPPPTPTTQPSPFTPVALEPLPFQEPAPSTEAAQEPDLMTPPPPPTPVSRVAEPTPEGESSAANSIGIAIAFPEGRESDAKILGQKIEQLTPRFTKAPLRLQVRTFAPLSPQTDWGAVIQQLVDQTGVRCVFLVVDRPLEDSRRRTLAGALDQRGIYFQEVALTSIEKKAFYTDMLLGLVFFFDSQRPGTNPA